VGQSQVSPSSVLWQMLVLALGKPYLKAHEGEMPFLSLIISAVLLHRGCILLNTLVWWIYSFPSFYSFRF